MVALITTLLITIGLIAQFYLKFSPLKCFVCLIASIIGFILAFSFYEPLASLLISRGYIVEWAQALCFALIAIIVPAIIIALADFVVGSNIDFGPMTKNISAVICGALTGIIISGTLDVANALAPGKRSIPYSRYGDRININNPSKPLVPADDIVAGLYKIISTGSMSSKNPFDVVHAKFLEQIHLNRYNSSEGVSLIAAREAVGIDKYGLTRKEIPGGDVFNVVTLNIKSKSVKEGGAMDKKSTVSFAPCQVRMICSKNSAGPVTGKDIRILYPERYLLPGKPVSQRMTLSETITFDRNSFTSTKYGRAARIDLAFAIPENMTPRYILFKSNTIVELPKLLSPEDIDEAIKADKLAEKDQSNLN